MVEPPAVDQKIMEEMCGAVWHCHAAHTDERYFVLGGTQASTGAYGHNHENSRSRAGSAAGYSLYAGL